MQRITTISEAEIICQQTIIKLINVVASSTLLITNYSLQIVHIFSICYNVVHKIFVRSYYRSTAVGLHSLGYIQCVKAL